jgi:hypothetical protein
MEIRGKDNVAENMNLETKREEGKTQYRNDGRRRNRGNRGDAGTFRTLYVFQFVQVNLYLRRKQQ